MLGTPLTRAADALLRRQPALCSGSCGLSASRPSAHRQQFRATAVGRVCICMAAQTPLHVAVIGAGAAGLVAARELLREGHDVTVYEQGSDVGGVWVYTEQTEDDASGIRSDRRRVHSSMYKTLRTNLPREVMAFSDFSFLPAVISQAGIPSTDDRQFPGHAEVYAYLKAFAAAFQLERCVRFNTQVVEALPVAAAARGDDAAAAADSDAAAANGAASKGNGPAVASPASPAAAASLAAASATGDAARGWERWQVTTAPAATQGSDGSHQATATFDALVVCNGHFSEPRLPDAPGADVFPGRQMHSHNYREAGSFAGQRVVVVGAAASGGDIGREIAETASQVWLSARQWSQGTPPLGQRGNITAMPAFEGLAANGSVRFAQGQVAEGVDMVVYATGYVYSFPFLEEANVITVEDNRVGPLYQHVWPPAHSPSLSFVGLPWKVVPFPQYELQARWIARVLSDAVQLPLAADMQGFYRELQEQGIEQRFTHRLDGDLQWEYNDWLARQCGPDIPAIAPWRPTLYREASSNRHQMPDGYRDLSLDAEAVEQAHREAANATAATQVVSCAA